MDRDTDSKSNPRAEASEQPDLGPSPNWAGLMPAPDGYAAPRGSCGDQIRIGLRIRGEIIEEAAFETEGCGYTLVCAQAVTALAEGRPVSEAMKIEPEDVAEALGGLPDDHMHCARLAVTTLRLACRDYLKNRGMNWKRLYAPRK
jgi:nitrogen fixation NifU-like protein